MTDTIPFTPELELCRKLCTSPDGRMIERVAKQTHLADNVSPESPFGAEKLWLPGQPRIGLRDPYIGLYLKSELNTPRLNVLAPRLWLVAKQDSTHISSLTHQIVRGRQIVVTENPELHLVWIYDRVYIKPIPQYLLSHAFWHYYLMSKASPIQDDQERFDLSQAARGFLRTYSHLIQHKSDFDLAMSEKHRLLPKRIRFSELIFFIAACQKSTVDSDVSPRYHYGELRLTRLNFWSKVFLHHITFHKVHGQYGAHFAQYYGPILFVFGVLSVALNAMQVILAGQQFLGQGSASIVFDQMSWGFSIFALALTTVLIAYLLAEITMLFVRELFFALKDLFRGGARRTGFSKSDHK